MEATLQTIFLIGFAAYQAHHPLPGYLHKAAWCLMNCRTAVMGGHIQACPEGHFQRNHYNSCKHRICPQCAFIHVQKWLSKQKERLLACDHYHVILTIPHELNPLWRYNREAMGNLLFQCARVTLFELLEDPKYLGAKVGVIASLHSWSKSLQLHPHVHCLVTGGGWAQRRWMAVKNDFLLPSAVVRDLFRGKVRAAILDLLEEKHLLLPEGMSSQQVKNLLNQLGRKKWNARIQEKYSHSQGVVSYLARYLRGGPIANRRIVRVTEDEVVFNTGREQRELLSLSIDEFISRYLQHVLPPHFIAVRYWGLYSNSAQQREYVKCREALGQEEWEKQTREGDWQKVLAQCFPEDQTAPWLCPVCQQLLIRKPLEASSPLSHSGDPPLKEALIV